MARQVVLYFMNLPSLQLLVLHTYAELLMRNCTVHVLNVVFSIFFMNCENQE